MTKKAKKSSNPSEPVAPPEAALKAKTLIQPADAGAGLTVNPAGMGGLEYVAGYEKAAPRGMSGLPDIGELSFGAPRRIIGTKPDGTPDDNRVSIDDTKSYPWSAIISLVIESPVGNGTGTGFFIGPKTIATCGHCLFIRPKDDPSKGDWATRITVIPGRNDSLSEPDNMPFGSIVAPRSALRSVNGWVQDGKIDYDYGAIILDTELGRRTGWFGFGAYNDSQLLAMIANLSGYPGDKGGGTQWFHGSDVTRVDAREVFYTTDMMPGHSGSPVFTIVDWARYAFAINAYQREGDDNFGTRIERSHRQSH
jgi:glutamyl endopeptidase